MIDATHDSDSGGQGENTMHNRTGRNDNGWDVRGKHGASLSVTKIMIPVCSH